MGPAEGGPVVRIGRRGGGTDLPEGGAKKDASGNAAETGTSTSQTPRLAQASPAPPEHEKSRGRFRSRL